MVSANLGAGRNRPEPERVHQHQPAEPVAVVDGEAGRDRAAEHVPDQHGRRRAGPLDQLAEPREHAVGVQRAVGHLRGAVAGQVGSDHAMGRHQLRDHPHPLGRELARAVQEDDRRAVAALQHGGRDAGQLQPSLGDRRSRPAAARVRSVVRSCCVLRLSCTCDATIGAARLPRIGANHPTSAIAAAWVVPPTSAQTSWCSYA